jgi:hypothetical protein
MALERSVQEYRTKLATLLPTFLLPRRFVADEGWTRAMAGGERYLGLFREYEPELGTILAHKNLVILGEPGAGKSTAGQAVIKEVLDKGDITALPVFARLKSYDGRLRQLLRQSAPVEVLSAPEIVRTFVFDGVDEVPPGHRETLLLEIHELMALDPSARLVLTARQAFAVHHPTAFPTGFVAYHLLDFDDTDIRECSKHWGVNSEHFLESVRSVGCSQEICNPFVLMVMLQQYKERDSLSPIRSDNVKYVVDRLIESRPLFKATQQRRALRMLAIACETAARNELTEGEALRVLLEAIDFPPEAAQQLLGELSQSILIRTPSGISFQMRSYGEYLAAEELHDKPVDRLKELAFLDNKPVETWLNAVTYLAEMNDKVRHYFATHHPEWLLGVSPAAFASESERTRLSRILLNRINQSQNYIVTQRIVPWRQLSRLLTTEVILELRGQLSSEVAYEKANALALLGLLRKSDIVPQALMIATEHRNASKLRYSAITALINAADNLVINDLLAFVDRADVYHLHVVDAIGSVCAPADFSRVLPLLANTNASYSSAAYHFGQLRTEEALISALEYLTAHPEVVHARKLDPYLSPVIDLLPEFWNTEIAERAGVLLARLERQHLYSGKLAERIIKHVSALDHASIAIRTMIGDLMCDGTPLVMMSQLVCPLVNGSIATWIAENARDYGANLASWLPRGAVRESLAPETMETSRAMFRYSEEQRLEHEQLLTAREQQRDSMCSARDIYDIIHAAAHLAKDYWPPLSPEQHEWLTLAVNGLLEKLDFEHSITWLSENQWTHPRELDPLLNLVDFYNLYLPNDVPVILALRSWSDKAISNYCVKNGVSAKAGDELARLLTTREHESITRNVLDFLRATGYLDPKIESVLMAIAVSKRHPAQLRIDAIERLGSSDVISGILLTLADDEDLRVRAHAFLELVKRQNRATVSRALATLTDDELRAAEVPVLESSILGWIGEIKIHDVIDELQRLRKRTLELGLLRTSGLILGTIANMDKVRASAVIRRQLARTPEDWRDHLRQEAEDLERSARVTVAQEAPFDEVIRKLKGSTSMIRVKVWCEGSTDRPIFRTLFREIGEHEIAGTLDFVGGWANLASEWEPERWLDGCREAFIVMDGDQGRKLNEPDEPLTDQAKDLERRFAKHSLTLKVLRRYGIENYLPQHSYETVLKRDLSAFFPIPQTEKIEGYIPSFHKRLNEHLAQHLTMADVEHTDLADVIRSVKEQAEAARHY